MVFTTQQMIRNLYATSVVNNHLRYVRFIKFVNLTIKLFKYFLPYYFQGLFIKQYQRFADSNTRNHLLNFYLFSTCLTILKKFSIFIHHLGQFIISSNIELILLNDLLRYQLISNIVEIITRQKSITKKNMDDLNWVEST